MAYTYTDLPEGELLVKDESKGVWQTIPSTPRPYYLIYLPENNNVYGVNDLADWEGENYEFIKVVF